MSISKDASLEPTAPVFQRGLGLFDSVMMVVGVMIGSGIFIVSAEMSRQIGSAGGILAAWVLTGVLTVSGALIYGELAAMMPRAGGMYVYLREAYSPFWGFLYGWTLCTVIQTGTIAAVSVAFARFTGVLWPSISESHYVISPLLVSSHYAVSLSTAQALAIGVIVVLTFTNSRGLEYGRAIQNIFTVAKTGALLGLIFLGLTFAANSTAIHANFHHLWAASPSVSLADGLMATTASGLFVAICISQTGSLFSADSWHDITFVAAEVKDPRRTLPLSLAIGTSLVILLYLVGQPGVPLLVADFGDAACGRRSDCDGGCAASLSTLRRRNHGGGDHGFYFRNCQCTDACRGAGFVRHGTRWTVLSDRPAAQ